MEVLDDPPVISDVCSVVTEEDTPTAPITFSITDEDISLSEVEVVITAADPALVPEDGMLLEQDGNTFSLVITPGLNLHGNTAITITATDFSQHVTNLEFGLTVLSVNDAPVADDQSVDALGDSTQDITLTASDVENDPLTFHVMSEPEFGILEGTPPNLTYIPTDDITVADSFTFIASDGGANSNVATVTINVEAVNATPSLGDDNYTTTGGCAVTTFFENGVLANDVDGDGDPLTVAIVDEPQHGTVILNEDGSFSYTPGIPLHQTDSFTYSATDGLVESEPATVTITIDSDGILVTTVEDGFVDDGLCSLREAIQAANTNQAVDGCMAGTDEDRILFGLATGHFELTSMGVDEDTNASGDLDIMSQVTMIGCGHADTVLDGKTNDRVLDVFGVDVVVENLTITAGVVTDDFGGGIRNGGNLTLRGVNVANNQTIGVMGADGNMPGGGGGGGGAAGFGGGIYNTSAGVLTVEPGDLGCFFTENNVTGGRGGNGRGNGGSFTGLGGTGGGYYGGAGGNGSNGTVGGFASGGGGGGGSLQRAQPVATVDSRAAAVAAAPEPQVVTAAPEAAVNLAAAAAAALGAAALAAVEVVVPAWAARFSTTAAPSRLVLAPSPETRLMAVHEVETTLAAPRRPWAVATAQPSSTTSEPCRSTRMWSTQKMLRRPWLTQHTRLIDESAGGYSPAFSTPRKPLSISALSSSPSLILKSWCDFRKFQKISI